MKNAAEQQETLEEKKRRGLLEEALGYVMPKKEAAKTCGVLLETLGGFDGVFAAPEEVLQQMPGVGPEAVRFLQLVVRLSQAYLEERSWNLRRIFDTESAVEMFRPKFLGSKTERVCLMLLDGRGRMVFNDCICEGSVNQVPLQMRRVLQLCTEYHSEDVLLAHNHPSGMASPSPSDLTVTDRLLTGLSGIGARLCDHIIFADESYYSFLKSGLLELQRNVMKDAQAKELDAIQRLGRKLMGEADSAQ